MQGCIVFITAAFFAFEIDIAVFCNVLGGSTTFKANPLFFQISLTLVYVLISKLPAL